MADSHVFSEKEASEVLRRAARLQEEKGGEDSYAPGLTREEILRIAKEAGIDPQNVEAAIRAVTASPPKRSFLNLVEEDERVVDSELDPSEFDVILEVAKPARTRRHPVGQVGRTLTMQTRYKGSLYNVEVSARNGRTRIRVTSNPLYAYLMSLHPAILLAVIGSGNIGAHGMNPMAVLFAVMTLIVGLIGFAALARRGNAKTAELADRIETAVRETTAHSLRENLQKTAPAAAVASEANRLST